MTNVVQESCRQNQNTQFMFNNSFFSIKRAVFLDNVGKYVRARLATVESILRRMCTA